MTGRRPIAAVAAVVAGVAGAAALALVTAGERGEPRAQAGGPPATAAASRELHSRRPAVVRSGPQGARVLRRVALRARPGGRIVTVLGPRTGYGSRRVLAVVGRRGRWLAVLSHHLTNSRAGWIPADGAELLREPYALDVDLSRHELVVRREGRVVRRVRVATGRLGTSTPTGRFGVTDALRISRPGGPYGCCALALTGRQPNVPQGWTGGDRIAIHGTTNEASLGTPASGGCLRASDADMRWLLRRVPLGATVRIRA